MTDEPEKVQQNLGSKEKINQSEASKAARFKSGFDKRRWLGGRGKKSPEQKQGEEILLAVIWDELSREFDVSIPGKVIPLDDTPQIDALRLMVRSWIKKKPELIAERIAGKVTDRVDVTSKGEKIKGYVIVTPDEWKETSDDS